MARIHTRKFQGPWLQAYAQMQLYLLEMLAARRDPLAIRIRLSKPLVTPDEVRRDFPPLRDALTSRLGSGRVQFEAVEGADSHEIQLEYPAGLLVK